MSGTTPSRSAPDPAPGTAAGRGTDAESAEPGPLRSVGRFRLLALAGVGVLTAAYVLVFREIVLDVGGTDLVAPAVALSAAAAALVARSLRPWRAALLSAGLLAVGSSYYLLSVPQGFGLLLEGGPQLVADAVALLTGLSAYRITRVDVWVLGFAPAPAFLSWYLAVRRRYLAGVVVGGAALLVPVLTGDAGLGLTLAGVLGGIAAVGFGELDRRGGTLLQADVLVVLVALITVASVFFSLVPAGTADPLRLSDGGPSTVEGTFVGTPGEMEIAGSIELSPAVRFTVRAERPRYWRTGVYDRFTGDSWARTGQARQYREGILQTPPGPRETLVQTYTVESDVNTMPAAAQPVEVVGEATENTLVTAQGTLKPASPFIGGEDRKDRYRVRSLVSNATPDQLRSAPTDYPDRIERRYTELPASTAGKLRSVTAEVVEGTDNPYDAAVRIERYLERTKNYSLDVQRPSGNVANKFLLEMDAGYCTYFATTMAVMLRAEGIPARIATGYSVGQRVGPEEWLVRGLDSHVWVEVYFPEYGWVQFDPTPTGPRVETETDRIREAREDEAGTGGDDDRVDTDESRDDPVATTPPGGNGTVPAGSGPGARPTLPGRTAVPGTVPGENPLEPGPGGNDSPGVTVPPTTGDGRPGVPIPIPLPSPRDAAVGGVLLLGAAAGAHRTGAVERGYRSLRLRYQGSARSPAEDVERAYERLELLLAREYRPRAPGETPREYVASLTGAGLDDRARRVATIRERARHAGRVDREAADEAVALVDDLVAERTPVLGRIRRRLN